MQRVPRGSTLVRLLAAAAFALTIVPAGLAADKSDGPASLFNGKDLTGWKVIGCEAVVEEGAILIKAGNGLVQAEQQYGDFVLEWDWKALAADNWDSGVYFRYQTLPPGRPWPAGYQVNLRKGMEGNVDGLPGAKSTVLVRDRDWNHFKLTVEGTKAKLEINGQPAWQADGLKIARGYLSLQAEVPQGGQFLFRNLSLHAPCAAP